MIKKLTLFISCIFLASFNSNGHAPAGGQVTYRCIGNYKFEITYKVYRDCRGLPDNNQTYVIRCASSGTSKTLSGTRISIKDISDYCPSKSSICNPPNQTASGSDPAFEEHTYLDTIDFNGNESSFKTCCIIQIGVGHCCRNGAITTGGQGNDFFVFSTLDLCKAPSNSSPVFAFKPTFVVYSNYLVMKSYLAKDTIDNDSLSYQFTNPLQSWTSPVNWSGGFDSKTPFTPYYPPGYNKAFGPNPNSNPATGIYLNPTTGNLVAQPINPSETSVLAISVKEWRKDTSGKFHQIGEIVIDQMIICITGINIHPIVKADWIYNICEGQAFMLDLPSEDKYVIPTYRNDTVTLSFDKGIKNATYSVPNPKLRLPVGKFEWTPSTGDSKKSPFMFTIIANDNNCSWRGRTEKTITLNVFPKIKVTSSIRKLNATSYSVGINISDKKYKYISGKYVTPTKLEDVRNFYFESSKMTYSIKDSDTLVFKKNGTYIINQTFHSEAECNRVTLSDTIVISNMLEVTLGMDPKGVYTDTIVCQNQPVRSVAKVTYGKRPITYYWKTSTIAQSDTNGYFDYAFGINDTLFLSVKDANGQTNSTFRVVNILEAPEINAGLDATICPGNSIKLKAKNIKPDKLAWTWKKDNTSIGDIDSIAVSAPGDYIVSATLKNGCSDYDTLTIHHFKPIKLELISGAYCQDKNKLTHPEIIGGKPNLNFKTISWKLLKTLPNTSGGQNTLNDLFTDKNPGAGYDFELNFNSSKIKLSTDSRESIILTATAQDTNGCFNKDTMTVSLIKTPTITLSKKPIDYCLNKSFNLDSFVTTGSNYKWIPLSRNGFGNWPSYSPLANGIIPAKYFSQENKYKVKIEANNEFCFAADSLVFSMSPVPKIQIQLFQYNTAMKFRDNTANVKSRKWYIEGVFITSADTMIMSNPLVHLKPVKLEVFGNNGCNHDTTIYPETVTTGINKIIQSNIEIYPNPANNLLVLKQSDVWMPSHFEIYDLLGKRLINGITKNREEIIDLKNITAGFYYLKYITAEGVISIPFIKEE